MYDNSNAVMAALWVSLESFFVLAILIAAFIDWIRNKREQKGRINEKNLKTLNDQLKKSNAIDQQQADRISLLLKESLSLLSQKKISSE
jgi:hypothetical protein